MTSPPIKAIVFDFDGVIVDSEPLHWRAFLEVMAPLGWQVDYPTYLARYVGSDDREGFAAMLDELGLDKSPPRIGELREQKQAAFEKLAAAGAKALPGSVALIDALADRRIPLAISSGATRRDIDLMLSALGRTASFEVIVSADEVTRSKPDPASYALAVQRLAERLPELDLRPSQCLAIEDTASGLTSAREAGLQTLALTTTTPADQLTRADRIVTDLTEIDTRTLIR